MTREEFYKLTDILNSEVLGSFMHGGKADELIAMFEEAVEHSNILQQEKPVSEDLGEYISELAKQFPEVSFAKLSRIAVRVAKWKDKEMQSIIELAEDHAMLAGRMQMKEEMMKNAVDGWIEADDNRDMNVWARSDDFRWLNKNITASLNIGDKVKLIIIKEE